MMPLGGLLFRPA